MDLSESLKALNRNQVAIKVEHLKVWTKEEKSWWRRKPTKPEVIILNNVSASLKTGDFVAVIGPSGAGKTTFLVSLAGKCTLPSTGTVTVNGTDVRKVQRGLIEIVPQFDVFMDSISVLEHLVFMTEMKLGSIKKSSHRQTLKQLLTELKLLMLQHSPISSLSGGERRLLSLATSLLSSPQILICDEPTTGLDSYNATLVIGVLKQLASSGKTVICSVHQPSSDLFKEFTSIALMSDGRLVFHGSQEDCKKLFKRFNLRCPKNYNPAEFYIKAVSESSSDYEKVLENNCDQPDEGDESGSVATTGAHLSYTHQRFWLRQVQLLLWRSALTFRRDIKNYVFQLFLCTMISSVIIGTCYVGISGTTQRGVQDIRGFLWLICSEVSFSVSYCALYAFDSDLILFRREVGVYSASAFYVSRFLSLMPRCVVWSLSYVAIATLMVDLPDYFLTSLKIASALVATSVASTAYGLGMGAMFISTGIMGDVMPCADLPLFLMSGAFLRISSLPFWLYPLKYFSHFYYGMDAISNIYWRQIDHIDCSYNTTSSCLSNGAAVLIENGYSDNFVLEDSLGILFITLVWSVLGFCGLKREENKGYAF
ncbi:protein brown-like isoform X1 [Maniola hyperantus]|uniref:protein brown-like isoform X1 n=2 Tax=Aphantopus hyperantus TaxID=2795564 RepID=UPI0015686DA7|nr:protein brown-like [Maniola hyperantus]